MKVSSKFFLSVLSLVFIFSLILIFAQNYLSSSNNFKVNPFKSNDKIIKTNLDYFEKPILISNEDDYFYQYKSKNYYGTLDIIDYQPPIENFNVFQEPNNVNIKGVPWDESQFILSLVIPVYNKINFLDRIFESIFNFTNNPKMNPRNEKVEIVFVDANSDDGSYEYAIDLAKRINKKVEAKKESLKLPKKENSHENLEKSSIMSNILAKFIKTNNNQKPQKIIRHKNALISIHEPSTEMNKSELNEKEKTAKIHLNDNNSNAKIRIVRRNTKTLSIIARQIGVEYSTGRYIWQVDPDDELHTSSFARIFDELRLEIEDPNTFEPNPNRDEKSCSNELCKFINSFENNPEISAERKSANDPPADMVEFGYCQYTYDNGVLPEYPACFPKSSERIVSNQHITFRFVTITTAWQLWQSIIKRDTFLKGIEAIKLHSPNQTKIIVADDLFIYSAVTYYAQVVKTIPLIGYFYYYMNQNSESLKIYKENFNTRLSARTILSFMHYLYDPKGLTFNERYSEL